ncbi:LIC_13387 family protein, partial [Variovorax sp. GrIS 2.14]|uniref:LIC_13387 family protein n=1 Tax=Variovorax sp. GrIS 2.14 TaxID=3071709 RepID=UPI0038F6459B
LHNRPDIRLQPCLLNLHTYEFLQSGRRPYKRLPSAAIIFLLGLVHLIYTFHGSKLDPRDTELKAKLMTVSPVISRETTMWRAWIGFNASHSYGAILFGAVYGYLAILHSAFLFQSWFLLAVGLLLLVGYAVLGKLYWFSIPFRGIVLAAVLYCLGLVFNLA